MFFWQAISILKEMYVYGGIEVCTRCNVSGNSISEADSTIYAWTLIQPDGDIINRVSENLRARPDIWRRHLENVEQKIAILREFRKFLKWVSVFSIQALLLTSYVVCTTLEKAGLMIWICVVMGLLLSIFLWLVRPLASYLLRWYIRRMLAKA